MSVRFALTGRTRRRLAGAATAPAGGGGGVVWEEVDQGASDYVVGNDWDGMSSTDIQNTSEFQLDYGTVSAAADSIFGTVVQLHYPVSAAADIQHNKSFPATQTRIWFRATYKWSADYTAAGNDPLGHANSQKHMFVLWQSANGRKEWEYSNTTQYVQGIDFRHTDGGNTKFGFTETAFPENTGWTNDAPTSWGDGEWYDFVFWVEITESNPSLLLNVGQTKHAAFKRRYTTGGVVNPTSWELIGGTCDFTENALSPGNGEAPPLSRAIQCFANRNKSIDTAFDIFLGPYEVKNSADPWGLKASFGL